MKQKINVIGTEVVVLSKEDNEYLSITDIARHKPYGFIKNW